MVSEIEEIKQYFDFRPKNKVKLQHFYISLFVSFMNLFIKNYKKDYNEKYCTVVGNTIYLPDNLYSRIFTIAPDQFSVYHKFNQGDMFLRAMIRHEFVHLLQREREPIMFSLKYIFSPKHRFLYEVEAYWISMLWRELAGEVDLDFKGNQVRIFTDGLYLFDMFIKDKEMFRRRCSDLVIHFMYPSIKNHISNLTLLDSNQPKKGSADYVDNLVDRLTDEMPLHLKWELKKIVDSIYSK